MSAFIFANVDVTYRELVAPTISAAGGRYRVRGGETRQLEGGYAPRRTVLLEFDSMAAALAWYESDAYAPAKALRQRTAVSDVILMEGVD
jgi:uncharacterized protein (DUF1330 family)